MKTTKIIYWTTTILLFLFEGVMPALTGNTEMAKQGISHLGYPDYFRVMLNICKVLGSLGLVLPFVKGRVKEWVYAGFVFDFVFAAASLWVVDGLNTLVAIPIVCLILLVISYLTYHKIQASAYEANSAQVRKSSVSFQ